LRLASTLLTIDVDKGCPVGQPARPVPLDDHFIQILVDRVGRCVYQRRRWEEMLACVGLTSSERNDLAQFQEAALSLLLLCRGQDALVRSGLVVGLVVLHPMLDRIFQFAVVGH